MLFRSEKRLNFTQYILFALLIVVISVPVIGGWWASRNLPIVSTIKIDGLAIVGESAVCPGEPLVWGYHFHAEGSGTLVRDRTLWEMTPPRTKIFSTREYFILDGPIEQDLIETWHVPHTYRNPETDAMEPLPPGHYKRILSISSPSRSTVTAIDSAEFEILGDCN